MHPCVLTHCPDKLVPGKFNIIATQPDYAAILWKDGEYFVVCVRHQDPFQAEPISEMRAFIIDGHGGYVHPEPIPLSDLSEWRKRSGEVNISLGHPDRGVQV